MSEFTLIVPPESPCGCGSGRTFGECHLQGNEIKLDPKNISPPDPPTGNSFRKCILKDMANCGQGMSGDHIVSASVLRGISSEEITITGQGFSRTLSLNSDSLKVKRLCRRHNAALSPIDFQAARLFHAVQLIEAALSRREISQQRLFLFEGFDIERWLLKTLLAVYHSRVTNVVPGKFCLPDYASRLFYSQLSPPYGLYFPAVESSGDQAQMTIAREVSVGLITERELVVGIDIKLSGLRMKYLMAGDLNELGRFSAQHVFRPKTLSFFEGSEVYCVGIAWTAGSNSNIWIARGDPKAIPPEDIWKENIVR